MLHSFHSWIADHVRWVQYPREHSIRRDAEQPQMRIPVTLLIASIYTVVTGVLLLAFLLYLVHLII
jgi:hypothetical protein